jgi:hypothetical protein
MRKPKYLDKARRVARAEREFYGGAKWSPTQRKDLLSRRGDFAVVPVSNRISPFAQQGADSDTTVQIKVYHPAS